MLAYDKPIYILDSTRLRAFLFESLQSPLYLKKIIIRMEGVSFRGKMLA